MAQYDDDGKETTIDNDTGDIVTSGSVGLQAITAAEINQAVLTAKQFPRRRDKDISNEIMGRATLSEAIAEKCNYLLPRGGKKIPGPSIRFAEIVRASFWNIRVAARFVALDTADMERAAVLVEAVALDVETNQSEIVPVRRSIMSTAKEGRRPQIYSADMINQTVQAAVSIARRNAILTVVPQFIWTAGYERVVEVLKGTVETLAARRVAMIEALQRAGVEPDQLFEVLGVKDETDIKIDHMPFIRGMMTALREGEPVDSVLGRRAVTENRHEVVRSPLKDDPNISTGIKTDGKGTITQGHHRAQATRGNMHDVNIANTVIDQSGTVTKSRNGEVEAPILDMRIGEHGQTFATVKAWMAAAPSTALIWPGADQVVESGGGSSAKSAETQGNAGADQAKTPSTNRTPESDDVTERSGEATDGAATGPAQDSGQGEKNAQASPAGPANAEKPYTDAPGFMAWTRDHVDAAKNKAAVTEFWGASRTDRNDMLDPDQIEELTKYKEAKLKKLKGSA